MRHPRRGGARLWRLRPPPLDMNTTRPHALSLALAVVLAVTGLGAFCPADARGPERARDADLDVARLSADLSEPGGYFDTDNLISNETSYLQVADQLESL